jgi:ribonuclease T1
MEHQPGPFSITRIASRFLLLLVALLSLWLTAACGGSDEATDGASVPGASLSTLSDQIAELQTEPTEAAAIAEVAATEIVTDDTTEAQPEVEEPTEALAATDVPTEVPPTATPRPAPTSTPAPTAVPARINGLPTILEIDLPPEGWDTLDAIDNNGPFPFDRDGIVFQNREGLLPNQPRGYYHEYTVITPGENDRGARRIVTGAGGEFYYTDDHYDSFFYIVRPQR